MLNSDWPIKTHNPRSKILESRQINTAKTNFRAFRQYSGSNKRRLSFELLAKLLSKNRWCFTRSTQEQNGPSEAKIEGNIVLTFQLPVIKVYNCVNQTIFWRRKGRCLGMLVMTQMDLPGKQAPAEHCSVPG